MRITRSAVALMLAFTLVSAPVPARAMIPVVDVTNIIQTTATAIATAGVSTKEYVLDTLAYQVANLAIQSMTKSIVNWINSGFQGSPAFVTDLNTNLRGVSDAVAARFFEELAAQNVGETLGQNRVLDAVRLGYYLRTSPESFYERYPSTLNQVSPDARAFLAGDFSQGGWDAWFATVMNPVNNPYGARDLINRELEGAISSATGQRLEELSWNRGFLSWRGECNVRADNADAIELSGADSCLGYEIRTPGSVIMESLNKVQGVPFERLVSADEFDEIIGALLNQLALQVLGGGDGGGVRGLSQPQQGGGASYFEQPDASNTGTSAASSFAATISRQREQLLAYRDAWERIRTAATAAESRCPESGNPNPQQVRVQAGEALVQAANAVSALEAIQTKLAAAGAQGGNQSEAVLSITNEYYALLNSDSFPSAEEFAEAQVQSQDTGDNEPASLYTRMTQLSSARFCNAAGD